MKQKAIEEVLARIESIEFGEPFDAVVAILDGGKEPARLVAQRLRLPVFELSINFRDGQHRPQHDEPILTQDFTEDVRGKRLLVVDDRSRTGKTFEKAREVLADAALVRTLAVNGKADYSLFDESCFLFPWVPASAHPDSAVRGDALRDGEDAGIPARTT